jgi:site-specific recombinase XerD
MAGTGAPHTTRAAQPSRTTRTTQPGAAGAADPPGPPGRPRPDRTPRTQDAGRRRRWQDVDHSDEPLLEHVVGPRSHQTRGPVAEFLAKKAAERAPKTHEWYRDSLLQLWGFLEPRGLTRVGDLDEHAVNLFRLQLRSRGAAENTVSNRLRAIKAFARWMAQRGWTGRNVLDDLHVPQSTRPRFDLIPDEARAALFRLFDPDTYLGSRNLAILAVLSDTGLRREEAANLLLRNVDLDGAVLKVYSDKTEEWRYVPLTDEAVAVLRNHLKWRERFFAGAARHRVRSVAGAAGGGSRAAAPGAPGAGEPDGRRRAPRREQSDRLFLTCAGVTLSPHGLHQVLRRAGGKAGLRLHAHLFRHDWITRKALDGESPSVVKRWAGHRSYAMTDYYFGLAEELLGAIQPKRSVLAAVALPGVRRRGRPPTRPAG